MLWNSELSSKAFSPYGLIKIEEPFFWKTGSLRGSGWPCLFNIQLVDSAFSSWFKEQDAEWKLQVIPKHEFYGNKDDNWQQDRSNKAESLDW